MAETRVNGIRLDYVRRCFCGRRPKISTGYKGFDDGTGPFVISCMHGLGSMTEQHEKVERGEMEAESWVFARSWSKTRVARNWNRMIRDSAANPPRPTLSGVHHD